MYKGRTIFKVLVSLLFKYSLIILGLFCTSIPTFYIPDYLNNNFAIIYKLNTFFLKTNPEANMFGQTSVMFMSIACTIFYIDLFNRKKIQFTSLQFYASFFAFNISYLFVTLVLCNFNFFWNRTYPSLTNILIWGVQILSAYLTFNLFEFLKAKNKSLQVTSKV